MNSVPTFEGVCNPVIYFSDVIKLEFEKVINFFTANTLCFLCNKNI